MNAKWTGRPAILFLAGVMALIVVVGAVLAFADDRDPAPPEVGETGGTATPDVSSRTTRSPVSTVVTTSTTVPPTAATPTPLPDTWTIEFVRTGGIAGVAQQLKVESGGQATFEDQRAPRTVNSVLGAPALNGLKTLIDGSAFFNQPPTQVTPCADCFQLRITLTLNARTHTVVANDRGAGASLQPLVEGLTALLQEGLR